MSVNQAGKGDTYREVNKKTYDRNFESINWGNAKKKRLPRIARKLIVTNYIG